MKESKTILKVANLDISLISVDNNDFISLTDIAKYRNADEPYAVINNWIRNRSTIEFIGLWERINNSSFKPLEFERFKNESGNNYFVLSPQKWIETTNAVGIISKSGRYGGTLAHIDIAFEFATWISSEFKMFLITEFKRLKQAESKEHKLEWNLQRTISKINYRIHTDAIKENLIPNQVTKMQKGFIYANEADVLNVALFGTTAKDWKVLNPTAKGNMRDDATIEQLVVLSNMESINALLIEQRLAQSERLIQLNKVAISQMKSLVQNISIKKIKITI